MPKFYFETYVAAAAFVDKHGIPAAAIARFGKGGQRCEVSVPAELAREIRAAA